MYSPARTMSAASPTAAHRGLMSCAGRFVMSTASSSPAASRPPLPRRNTFPPSALKFSTLFSCADWSRMSPIFSTATKGRSKAAGHRWRQVTCDG